MLAQRYLMRLAAGSYGSIAMGLFSAAVLLAALIWMGMLHWGSWLEWAHRRSPLAWGSVWYYAEMYWYYLDDPQGWLVLLASLAAAAGLIFAWLLLLILELSRAVLTTGKWLLQKTPRGLTSGVLIVAWFIVNRN